MGLRFPDWIKHFSRTIMFRAGKGTIDFLRGGKFADGKIDLTKVNFFLPSPRTLRKAGPEVKYYDTLSPENLSKAVRGLPKGLLFLLLLLLLLLSLLLRR